MHEQLISNSIIHPYELLLWSLSPIMSLSLFFFFFFFVLFFFWIPLLCPKDWFSNQYLSLSIITMTHFSDNIIFFSFFFFFFSFAFPFETLFVHNRLISSPISTNTNYCCGPLSLTMSFSLLFLLVWLHSYHFFSNNVILSFSFGRRSFSLLFMN